MPGQVGTASGRSLATRSQMTLLKVGHGCCPTIAFWAAGVAIASHSKGVSIGEQRYSVANVRASAALGLTLS